LKNCDLLPQSLRCSTPYFSTTYFAPRAFDKISSIFLRSPEYSRRKGFCQLTQRVFGARINSIINIIIWMQY